MPGEVILVVDDNASNLELMDVVLRAAGYEVHCVDHPYAALGAVQRIHPRVIMMDIQLPDIDGLELTRRIKSDPATSDTIILATTGYAMASDKQKALDAGCDGYISKPIRTRELPAMIGEYLAQGNEAARTA